MTVEVEKEDGKIPGEIPWIDVDECGLLMWFLEGHHMEEMDRSKLDLAQRLSLKFGGDKGGGLFIMRPGLLRATYLSVLNGQVPFEDSLFEIRDLTSQQKEIVKLMSEGKSNKQIAEDMGIAKNDVGHRFLPILGRWKVANLFQVMAIAAKLRILELE